MGTRHLIFVYYKGKYHIAQYGQFDGYPEVQGADVLVFIRIPENILKLRAALDEGKIYTVTIEFLEELEVKQDEADRSFEERVLSAGETWSKPPSIWPPSLSRLTGAKILSLVAEAKEPIPIYMQEEFIFDHLLCEWAYVVDLDKNTFEVFANCPEEFKIDSDRFTELKPTDHYPECMWHCDQPPQLSGLWHFDNLPTKTKFLDHFDDKLYQARKAAARNVEEKTSVEKNDQVDQVSVPRDDLKSEST